MSNGENFFRAPKGTRGDSFSFDNQASDDNTVLVHPFPVAQAPSQKVDPSAGFDRLGDTDISYQGTPFGGDEPANTHYQPVDLAAAQKTLPGEQDDPRLC